MYVYTRVSTPVMLNMLQLLTSRLSTTQAKTSGGEVHYWRDPVYSDQITEI